MKLQEVKEVKQLQQGQIRCQVHGLVGENLSTKYCHKKERRARLSTGIDSSRSMIGRAFHNLVTLLKNIKFKWLLLDNGMRHFNLQLEDLVLEEINWT